MAADNKIGVKPLNDEELNQVTGGKKEEPNTSLKLLYKLMHWFFRS